MVVIEVVFPIIVEEQLPKNSKCSTQSLVS